MSSKVYKLFGKTTILMTIVAMMMLSLFAGGQNILIKAEEGQSREAEYPEHVVDTFSPQGTVINLFDYWVQDYGDPDIEDMSPAATHLSSGINKDHQLKFKQSDETLGNSNQNLANKWTGYDGGPRYGIVKDTLENSYPVLSTEGINYGIDEEESLSYLFNNESFDGKKAYSDVQNLLQIDDEGYYYYNSSENYAYFDEESNSFIVYDRPAVTTGHSAYPIERVGQFFPFNPISEAISDPNGFWGNNSNWQDNTDCLDPEINHYFGASMTTRFIQPEGGMISRDRKMTYEFSGDDDVWIFIDDVLVADLGGIHSANSTYIDFSTGRVYISNDEEVGTGRGEYNESFSLYELYENAGVSSDRLNDIFVQNGGNYLFRDDTVHTLKFFYLERGGSASNMRLRFNLKTIPENAIIKTDEKGSPMANVRFSLYATGEDYVVNEEQTPISVGSTDESGYLLLTNIEDPDTILDFNDLYQNNNNRYYVLREEGIAGSNDNGYRSTKDIRLEYVVHAEGQGLVKVRNTFETGSYASPSQLITIDDAVYTINNQRPASVKTGLVFAVILYKDETRNDCGEYGCWFPISGDSLNGWHKVGDSLSLGGGISDGLLAAARDNYYVAKIASSGGYEIMIDELPGDIADYYFVEPYGATFTVALYHTSAVRISDANSSNTRLVDTFENSLNEITREFAATVHITNNLNRLIVEKLDSEGNVLGDPSDVRNSANARFALYAASQVDTTGDYPVLYPNATPYDTVAVNQETLGLEGINRDNIAVFPSTESKPLINGTYYLKELSPPEAYKANDNLVEIKVSDEGVFANAGVANDGIYVRNGVGNVSPAVSQFSATGDIDNSLTNIVGTLETSSDLNSWDSSDSTVHLKYYSTLQGSGSHYYIQYGSEEENAPITIGSDIGWTRLKISQCDEHRTTPRQELDDVTGSFSGTTIVQISNNPLIGGSKTVNGKGTWGNDTFTISIEAIKKDGNEYQNASLNQEIVLDHPHATDGQPVTFELDDINFTESGKYVFKVAEVKGEGTYVYDENSFYFSADVKEDALKQPGVLKVKYERCDENGNALTTNTGLQDFDFVNTYYSLGNLNIRKVVNAEAGLKPSEETNFELRVSFELPDNFNQHEYKSAVIEAPEGSIDFADLINSTSSTSYTLNLKAGDSGQIVNIPIGTSYVIEEINMPKGYTMAPDSQTSGVIDSASSFTATIYNNYQIVEQASENITISKELNGRDWESNDEFSFSIRGSKDALEYNSTLTISSITSEHQNSLALNFEKPGNYVYTVWEIQPSTLEPGMSYANERYTVSFIVEDNGQGGLDVTKTISKDGSQVTEDICKFVNTYSEGEDVEINLSGSKNYTDNSGGNPLEDDMFAFTVSTSDDAPKPEGVSGNSWTVKNDGASISFGKIVVNNDNANQSYKYVITETKGDMVGMTYDDEKYTVTLNVQYDNEKEVVKAQVSVVNADNEAVGTNDIVFTNAYDAKEISTDLGFNKELNVPEGFDVAKINKTFEFLLTPTDETLNAYKSGDVLINDYQASISTQGMSENKASESFEKITFKKAGSYTFEIKEVVPDFNDSHITYDTETIKVAVDVRLNEGKGELEVVSVNYTKGETSSSEYQTFVNSYDLDPSDAVKINGTKIMKGIEMQANDFTFTLTSDGTTFEIKNSNPVKNNEGDYEASIENILDESYSEVGTYTYTVKENQSHTRGLAGVIDFDDRQYTIEITVEYDYANDCLKATPVIKNNEGSQVAEIIFENTYDPSPLAVDDNLRKSLEGKELTDGQFKFTLSLDEHSTDPSGVTINNADLQNDASGNIPYRLVFNKPGDYFFNIVEVDDKQGGIIYDAEEKTVWYRIDRNAAGELYIANSSAGEVKAFTNKYEASGMANIDITKVIDGRDWNDDSFTFRIEANDETTKAALENGSIVFMNGNEEIDLEANAYYDVVIDSANAEHSITQSLRFSGNGNAAYSFKISELEGTSDDLDYDKTEKIINFTQSDNGEGTLTITPSEANVSFTNNYLYQGENAAHVSLNGQKTINKPADAAYVLNNDEFSFTLIPSESNSQYDPLTEAKVISSGNSVDGISSQFTIFDNVEYVRPGTYTYTMQENLGVAPGITYDPTTYTIVVNVQEDGDTGKLLADVSITKGGESSEQIEFVNDYNPNKISLNISGIKELWFAEELKEFAEGSFSFELKGIAKEEVIETASEIIENPTEVNEEESVEEVKETLINDVPEQRASVLPPMPEGSNESLKVVNVSASNEGIGTFNFGAIAFDRDDIGKSYSYEVKEVIPDPKDSHYTYDERVYEISVTVNSITDEASGIENVLALDVVYRIKGGDEVENISFKNTYAPSETTVHISGTKILTLNDAPSALNNQEFTFIIQKEDGETFEVANDAEGNFSLDLVIDDAETVFTVYEKAGNDAHISYSNVQYQVVVKAHDENGAWEVDSIEYKVADELKDGIVFENIYSPDPVEYQVVANKKLTGRELVSGEFSFELLDENGEVAGLSQNDEDGNIIFTLASNEAGTKVYQLKEVKGNDLNITYDDAVYYVTVETVLNGREYQVNVSYSDGENTVTEMVFNNKYQEPEPAPTPTPSPDTDNHYIPVPNTAAK